MVDKYMCSVCGKEYYVNYVPIPDRTGILNLVDERNICWSCAYWTSISENRPNNLEVNAGECFVLNPSGDVLLRGSKRGTVYILKGKMNVFSSNEVWKIGKVPAAFRDRFPDTCRIINKEVYRKLNYNPFVCKKKGCWDRYHCLRYDMELERNGAWNIVPAKHKIGDEGCECFINKELVL